MEQKKKEPGLKFNPGLALIGLRTTGSWGLEWGQGSIFPVVQLSQTTTISYGWLKITSKVALQKSQVFAQPQNLFKTIQKFLYDFIHFPCVLITSCPLKTFRILENNKQLLSAMKYIEVWAPSLMVQYYLWNNQRLSFFCEVLHSEAIHRKRDSTHQDEAFFLESVSLGKKSEAEAGAIYASRSDVF